MKFFIEENFNIEEKEMAAKKFSGYDTPNIVRYLKINKFLNILVAFVQR